MNIWTKLSEVNVQEKQRFASLFAEIVHTVQNSKYTLTIGEKEEQDHVIVQEENRADSHFISIVPKEVFPLFKEMQKKAPQQFLGYSILAGKKEGKDVRVTCFGVPCNLLAKALI